MIYPAKAVTKQNTGTSFCKHVLRTRNTYTRPTAQDYLELSWIPNQSPALPYGSPNVLESFELLCALVWNLAHSPFFFGSLYGFVLYAWFYEKFSDQNVNKWLARLIKITLLSLMFLLGNVNDFTVGSEGWQSRQRWELFICWITALSFVYNVQ